jgi:hypothetical protein
MVLIRKAVRAMVLLHITKKKNIFFRNGYLGKFLLAIVKLGMAEQEHLAANPGALR